MKVEEGLKREKFLPLSLCVYREKKEEISLSLSLSEFNQFQQSNLGRITKKKVLFTSSLGPYVCLDPQQTK